MKIILASGSPRRKELLEQIGLKFEVIPAKGEEIITKTVPSEIVCELSLQKAEEVAALTASKAAGRNPAKAAGQEMTDAAGREERETKEAEKKSAAPSDTQIVIGADTVVCLDGEVMGKPSGRDEAVRMLESLQGRKHSVYTGVSVLAAEPGREMVRHTFFCETKVEIYPMQKCDIEEYVDTGEPMDKAGAYGIQGRFAAWVKSIEGDYNNVVGLPVSALWQVLKDYR